MLNIKCVVSVLILQIFCGQLVFAQPDRGVVNKPTLEKRLALVIGNGAYQKTSELPNPPNDATDMAASLSTLGFEVLSGTNQSKRQMEILIREFGDKLSRQGGVGLFFYAGHGLQVKGSNYLIPVDAEIPAEDEVEYATVNLNFLLNKMDAAKNDLNIVILDACRNNPFARSWRNFRDVGEGGGLAKITPPTGTIMLYATQPGNVASDGTGRNGLFTESLLEQIRKPDLELDAMIKQLARDVSEKSGKKQMPWKEGIVTGDFYFAGGGGNGAQPVSNPIIINSNTAEDVMWQEVARVKTKLVVDGYLSEYPNGKYAPTARLMLKAIVAEDEKNTQNRELRQWEEAAKLNSIEAYQNYLKMYPNGIQKDLANSRINQLIEKAEATVPRKGKSIKNTLGMEFNGIPAGSFLMGSAASEKDRDKDLETQHQVTLSKGFWLGKYEVTQSQWREVMGSIPQNCGNQFNPMGIGDDKPVVCVSWDEVQEFIRRLNTMGKGRYRLPTEAEWEYSARAETSTAFYWGDDDDQTKDYAWARKFAGQFYLRPVGEKLPNNFGLYDMSGNVNEWVSDFTGNFLGVAVTDPRGPTSGQDRVARGGSFMDYPKKVRSATRFFFNPSRKSVLTGFRLVMEN